MGDNYVKHCVWLKISKISSSCKSLYDFTSTRHSGWIVYLYSPIDIWFCIWSKKIKQWNTNLQSWLHFNLIYETRESYLKFYWMVLLRSMKPRNCFYPGWISNFENCMGCRKWFQIAFNGARIALVVSSGFWKLLKSFTRIFRNG